MDGKLLILCDELPKDYEGYSVKDIYFLKSTMIDPEDNSDRLFVCWDAVIPKDQSFLNQCWYYATTYKKMPIDFRLKQTGKIDPKNGSIKGSIQEDSFIRALDLNIESVRRAAAKGEDYRAEAIELAGQYTMQATEQFLEDFSAMLNLNGVVRILPAHKEDTDYEVIRHRTLLLEAWENQNRLMREKASGAKLVEPMVYHDFGEVFSRSSDEIMKVYSLPIFGEAEEETNGRNRTQTIMEVFEDKKS